MDGAVKVRTFSQVFAGQDVHFYILCLKQSFMLWASTDIFLKTLSVAMNTRFVSDLNELQSAELDV